MVILPEAVTVDQGPEYPGKETGWTMPS